MKQSFSAIVSSAVLLAATVSVLQLAGPVWATEESGPQTPCWVKNLPSIAQRVKNGQFEDDKDEVKNGGTVSFNTTNMEVKCQATRGDGDTPKSSSGRAAYQQKYVWNAYGTTTPPAQYFRIDQTLGEECHAKDFSNPAIADATLRPGPAEGKGTSSLAIAKNDAMTTLDFEQTVTISNKLIDVGQNPTNAVYIVVETAASASASSIELVPEQEPPIRGQPAPLPPTPTYPNKGCFAEGRTYWKHSQARPYVPPLIP